MTQTGQLTLTETERDFKTVNRETGKQAANPTFLTMGSSASKKDKTIGDNKASVSGSVLMDKNTEYSIILLHTGTAISIIIVITIMAAIYYNVFKIRCTHTNSSLLLCSLLYSMTSHYNMNLLWVCRKMCIIGTNQNCSFDAVWSQWLCHTIYNSVWVCHKMCIIGTNKNCSFDAVWSQWCSCGGVWLCSKIETNKNYSSDAMWSQLWSCGSCGRECGSSSQGCVVVVL